MGTVTPFPQQREATAPRPRTVLVVEDDVLVRMATAAELRDRGLDVLEACNAEEAVAVLQSQVPVGLVFTDVQMPGSMDGLALAALVAKTHPGLKVVVTSGNGNCEIRAAEVADAFFPKPYLLDRVSNCIRDLLADDVA
jgi:DNA-binding NtrC family response regulator